MTVPVSVLSPTCLDVQDAASANTAWAQKWVDYYNIQTHYFEMD